jgi:hypothetical protein
MLNESMLKNNLQQILTCENLDAQRLLVKDLVTELGVEIPDLAAALLYLNHRDKKSILPIEEQKFSHPTVLECNPPSFKFIRYRLAVGSQHQVTENQLKKMLVDESGVDKNNINNVLIQGLYTLLDLPDNMPQDIFLHLKSMEINNQKLDIKRVKSGNHKKRGKNRSRRGRQRNSKLVHVAPDPINGG